MMFFPLAIAAETWARIPIERGPEAGAPGRSLEQTRHDLRTEVGWRNDAVEGHDGRQFRLVITGWGMWI